MEGDAGAELAASRGARGSGGVAVVEDGSADPNPNPNPNPNRQIAVLTPRGAAMLITKARGAAVWHRWEVS